MSIQETHNMSQLSALNSIGVNYALYKEAGFLRGIGSIIGGTGKVIGQGSAKGIGILGRAAGGVTKGVGEGVSYVGNAFNNVGKGISSGARAPAKALYSNGHHVAGAIADIAASPITAATTGMRAVGNAGRLTGATLTKGTEAIQAAARGINRAGDAVNKMPGAIHKAFTVHTPPPIPSSVINKSIRPHIKINRA